MKKSRISIVFFLLLMAVFTAGCTDFTDKDGKYLKEVEPFINYTFEEWRYEEEEVEIFTGLTNTDHTRYTVFYEDYEGISHHFFFDSSGSVPSESVPWTIEREMLINIAESLKKEIEEKTEGSVQVHAFLTDRIQRTPEEQELLNKEKMDYKSRLFSLEEGIRLYNVNEFLRNVAPDFFESFQISMAVEKEEDQSFLNENKDWLEEIVRKRVGEYYNIVIQVNEKLETTTFEETEE